MNAAVNKESGVSLLEVLLSVSLGAIIIIGAVTMAKDWAERVRHRDEATYLLRVQNAAKSYVAANYSRIMTDGFGEALIAEDNSDLVNVGRALFIPLADAGGDFHLIGATGGLPEDFPDTTPLGRNVSVYVRNLGFIGKQRMLEVFTVTDLDDTAGRRPLTEIAIRDIAQSLGPEAGIYRTTSTCQSAQIQSVYGSWSLPNNLLSSGRLMPGSSAYCPPNARGFETYVALQGRVSYEDGASSSYLYRVSIPGAPHLNRMETNLDMGNNQVMDVATLQADNIQVQGNARIMGQDGSGAALFVDQHLRVAGTGSTIVGKQEITPSGARRIYSGGNLITNNLNIATLNAANGSLSSDNVAVDGRLNVEGTLGVTGNISVANTMTAEQVAANGISARDSFDTSHLQVLSQASVRNVSAARATAATLNVEDTLTVSNRLQTVGSVAFSSASNLNGGLTAGQFQLMRLTKCTATKKYTRDGRLVNANPAYDCRSAPK